MEQVIEGWYGLIDDGPQPDLRSIAAGLFQVAEIGWLQWSDVFYLQFGSKVFRPAMTTAIGDILWRFDPETGEVLGAEIEHFSRHFILDRPAFATLWDKVRPRIAGADGFVVSLSPGGDPAFHQQIADLAVA